MKKWLVHVSCRQSGAIGIFEVKTFELELPEEVQNTAHERWKFFDVWCKEYGDDYEYNGIHKIEEVKP